MSKYTIFFGFFLQMKKYVLLLHSQTTIGLWCNGNTTDSGPVILGSNPGSPTESADERYEEMRSFDERTKRRKRRMRSLINASFVVFVSCAASLHLFVSESPPMKRHESEACAVTEFAIDRAASLALSVLMVDIIKKGCHRSDNLI